ncbi:MAG: DNA polymerase III subunit delta' [Thermodesulfobacteriota bacterium]
MRFADISGHKGEIRVLTRSVAGGHVAHAYLFSGPEGVGKGLVALGLAAALNCTEPASDGDSCGRCPDCRAVAGGAHARVVRVEPDEGVIRIERVREVAEGLRYRIDRGRKVVIVDDADRLHPSAANCFLKTLEEPPPASVIILVTPRATELLPTIISRCQRLNFRPLAQGAVKDHLVSVHGVAPEAALLAARLSGGSISGALRYIEEGGAERRREVVELVSSLDPSDAASILDAAGHLSKRDDLPEVLEVLKGWYRDRAVSAEGAPELVDGEAAVPWGGGPEGFSGLYESFRAVEEARGEITPPRYANRLLTMEALLLRIVGGAGAGGRG